MVFIYTWGEGAVRFCGPAKTRQRTGSLKTMPYRTVILALAFIFPAALYAQSTPPLPGTSDADGSVQSGPLGEAEAAIEAKSFDKARTLLDTWLSVHSNDARALFDRGYCDDAQGKDDFAQTFYRKAIAADSQQFEAHLALGLLLVQTNSPANASEARTELETATNLNPTPPNPAAKAQAYRALARLLQSSDPDAAKKALLATVQLTPETTEDALLAAQIAENEGDRDIAEQAYRRVLEKQPESSVAIAGLAHLLLAEKKYSDAEPLVKSALVRDPDDPALNAQYAAILSSEGKTDEAAATLEKLHKLEPQNRQISNMLADLYMQAGNAEKASAVYTSLLATTPNDPDLLSAQGQLLIREEKYPEALALLQRAVKVKPDDADAWSGIAFAASKTAQPQLELDALAARSKYAAETAVTYFLWATAHDNLHHKKEAVEYYHLFLQSALGKFPDEEWQAKQRLAILEK
jgi:predicted Zn-dependent protease